MKLDLSKKIKAYRDKANISLRELAGITGVSAATLCRIENGEIKCDRHTEDRINNWIDKGAKLPKLKSLDERLESIEKRLAALEESASGEE